MNKLLSVVLFAVLLTSCKAKKAAVPSEITTTVSDVTIANIINNHYAVKRDFKTAYIKSNIDYTDPKQSLGLSADIRIKKDEIILVSVKMLGITMAKALITPTQVNYYEKLNGNYFEGDYKMLSNWLGTDLDFQKVQNMLIGKTMDELSKGKFKAVSEGSNPKLEEISEGNFAKSFVFEPNTFWLKQQEIQQFSPERKLLVHYPNYKSYPECVFPQELAIFAIQGDKTTTIAILNKNVSFNEELTFPYSVPSGYKQIIIK